MNISKSVFVFTTLVLACVTTQAQIVKHDPKNGTITKVAKFKPPVVKAFLGRNSDTVSITLDEANQLVGLPIKVTDDKNNVYTVTSYGFMYTRVGIVQNEETGKKESKITTIGDQFFTTPLPEIWRSNIAQTLKKNEKLFFFDIIVKDKQNRAFFAPNILIKVI